MRCALLFALVLTSSAAAQPAPRTRHVAAASNPERRAVEAFDAAYRSGPLALHAFLAGMPKGADLHMHLSGAVYAETFLRDAVHDGACVDPVRLVLVRSTAPAVPPCPDGAIAAATVDRDQHLYDELIDSFSMRDFVPTSGFSGHDQFFATFGRFGGLKSHNAEWLDEVATRAAAQNEQYLEVMMTPPFTRAANAARAIGWPADPVGYQENPDLVAGTSRAELAAFRAKLLADPGVKQDLTEDISTLDADLAERRALEHCDDAAAVAACSVKVRVLYQVLRQNLPAQVFAQALLAFEVAQRDSASVVGLNFVQPEDAYLAMSEYHRQMLMLDYLHSVYPQVHITLHAGELAPGLVPPHGLSFHIRQAVDLGHAERIGHGVDVMYERDPKLLLKELADRHVMIEINLTSNDVILGVKGNQHSFPEYRAAHVPVALSTDDEGVSRIDLTHEYARAAIDFHLNYLDLKQMARTSLEHAFLPGDSLWAAQDVFTKVKASCADGPLGAETPSATCSDFLRANARAAEQWELEHRFRVFESGVN